MWLNSKHMHLCVILDSCNNKKTKIFFSLVTVVFLRLCVYPVCNPTIFQMATTTDGKRQLCCVLTYESVFPHYAFGQLQWCIMSPFTAMNPSPTVSISCLMVNGQNYLPLWCFFLLCFDLGGIFRSENKEKDHRGEDQLQKEDGRAVATTERQQIPHPDEKTPGEQV